MKKHINTDDFKKTIIPEKKLTIIINNKNNSITKLINLKKPIKKDETKIIKKNYDKSINDSILIKNLLEKNDTNIDNINKNAIDINKDIKDIENYIDDVNNNFLEKNIAKKNDDIDNNFLEESSAKNNDDMDNDIDDNNFLEESSAKNNDDMDNDIDNNFLEKSIAKNNNVLEENLAKNNDNIVNDINNIHNNINNKKENKVFFLFCSITFLQIYLPLIKELYNRKIKSYIVIRKNAKTYANPNASKHRHFFKNLFDKYKCVIVNDDYLYKDKGIIICVDGDIYGLGEDNIKDSLLIDKRLIRSNFIIYSLIENLNFLWCYKKYALLIDYLILPNKIYAKTYGLKTTKNIYLGNPKYNIKLLKNDIYNKYGLIPDKKYVLIFYPRFDRGIKKYGKSFLSFYNNLHIWLSRLGYTIIVKTREKLHNYSRNHINLASYFINDKTLYPPTSLELIKISSLVVFFGSSVIEEVVMYDTPFIEVIFDNIDRFSFLRNEAYTFLINEMINYDKFKTGVLNITNNPNRKTAFETTKKEYLFKNNCVKDIINYIMN